MQSVFKESDKTLNRCIRVIEFWRLKWGFRRILSSNARECARKVHVLQTRCLIKEITLPLFNVGMRSQLEKIKFLPELRLEPGALDPDSNSRVFTGGAHSEAEYLIGQ